MKKYTIKGISATRLSVLLWAVLIFVGFSIEAQTFEDQEWKEAVARATVSGRTIAVELLTNPKYQKVSWIAEGEVKNLGYDGQPLNKVLLNKRVCGTNQISLNAMFTLKQVITGEEPEVITYELPVSYDALINIRPSELEVLLDSPPGDDIVFEPMIYDCKRAANGDTLLRWNTTFERPGQYAVQALLSLEDFRTHGEFKVRGPVIPYFSSNLCQFFPGSSMFSDTVAFLDAKVLESNAMFKIEVKTLSGKHVKTLSGSTSNGLIRVDWNLLDDKGHKYTNDDFESSFTVKLSGSDRWQTLKNWHAKIRR